jgi:hypothetical protein
VTIPRSMSCNSSPQIWMISEISGTGGRGQNCSSSRQDIWSTASKIGEARRTSGSAPTE